MTLSVFIVNLMLFALKLYIGLSSNSISIYSDGINNFFDSLSGIISFIFLGTALKSSGFFAKFNLVRTEQLLTFLISTAVGASGLYFFYNSVERLMYPTPIWFKVRYLYLLCLTTAVKLLLYFLMRYFTKKEKSPILKAMTTDSLLDFFIALMTVISLIISRHGTFAFDAVCGIGISIVIIISAFRMIKEALRDLTGFVSQEEREQVEELIRNLPVKGVDIMRKEGQTTAYITLSESCDTHEICGQIKKQTDITAIFIV